MADDVKNFPTLQVATLLTGVGLCSQYKFSDMLEPAEQILGYPVFLHELGHAETMDRIREIGAQLFPNMPTREDAQLAWRAAAVKAIDAYGQSVTVPRGTDKRQRGPATTALEMRRGASNG
jgi:hypothetical protein